jgi:RNA polymerase sigma-70 factor (ECF subfamily)
LSLDFRLLFDERSKREEPLLRAYLRRRVRRHEDIDDYVQEVYARVLATPQATPVSNWQGFLRRIAANLLIDRARRAKARFETHHVEIDDGFEPVDDQPTSEQALMARQRLAAVVEALKDISPVARSAFLLVRLEGLSHRDAAERLDLDVKIVSRHVERTLILISRRVAENL